MFASLNIFPEGIFNRRPLGAVLPKSLSLSNQIIIEMNIGGHAQWFAQMIAQIEDFTRRGAAGEGRPAAGDPAGLGGLDDPAGRLW